MRLAGRSVWRFLRLSLLISLRAGILRTAMCAVLVVGCLAGGLLGQSGEDGAIGGRVLGAAGVPVSGAVVTVREVETGLALHVRSGRSGEFLVARLPAGEYAVTVEEGGAVRPLASPVAVRLGEVTELDVRRQPPSLSGGWVVRQATAQGEAVLGVDEVGELPVAGGDWRSLALTTAGANGAATEDAAPDEVSFRGAAVGENSARMDGLSGEEGFSGARAGAGVAEEADAGSDDVSDRSSGVGSGQGSLADGGQRAGSAFTFSQAVVREFRVQGVGSAAVYGSALYGHGVGGVVTSVSRSGGAKLHGMVFYTVWNSAWAAVNPFSVESHYVDGVVTNALVKPLDMRQQFGGRISGPIGSLRNGQTAVSHPEEGRHLFFLYAFDQQVRNFPAISSPGYAGFYALTPAQTALLATRGVTAAKTMAALNYLDGLTGTVPRQSNQTVNFGRLDWNRRGGSRIVVEYNRARWSNPAGARTGAVVDRGVASIGSSFGAVDAGVGRWIQFLRGGASDEMRAQYGRQLQYETAQTPLPQEPNVGPGGLPPEVSIGPQGFVFGTPAALGQKAYPDERRLELVDVLAWARGRHLIRLGGDFSLVHDFTDSLTNVEGTFNYDSGTGAAATGGSNAGGIVDWISDFTFNVTAYPNGACPSIFTEQHYFCFRSYSQSFGQQSLSFFTQEWAAFAQDDWRVGPRFTAHLGVRYEYQFLPLPQQPNAALDEVFGHTGATSVYPEDRNNVGPRLGFAWEPLGVGRGMLRVGYGAYYGKLPGATVRTALLDTALPNSVTRVRILPTTETACPQTGGSQAVVGFGYACSFAAAPAGVVAATTSAVVFDGRFRLPMVQQGTISLEHGIGAGVMVRAGYAMNLDRQLPGSVDINIAPSTSVKQFQLQGGTAAAGARNGELFAVPAYTERVSTSFGPVTDMVSRANATYNGATLEAQRGFGSRRGGVHGASGLEFRVGWTWSKAIDYGQNAGATPRTNGQFDPFAVRYDKGLSALNFPHRVVATAIWTPRVGEGLLRGLGTGAGAGAKELRAALEGWSLSGIFSEASGRAYSYDIFGGTRLAGGHESINGSGGSVVLPTVGRNTLKLPDTANLDARLSRSLRLSEHGARLQLLVEAFNVMNHLNYSGVIQRAFLVGAPGSGGAAAGVTPLVFQDAATVATEGLNVQPFGAYTAAGTSQARERQVQAGVRIEF